MVKPQDGFVMKQKPPIICSSSFCGRQSVVNADRSGCWYNWSSSSLVASSSALSSPGHIILKPQYNAKHGNYINQKVIPCQVHLLLLLCLIWLLLFGTTPAVALSLSSSCLFYCLQAVLLQVDKAARWIHAKRTRGGDLLWPEKWNILRIKWTVISMRFWKWSGVSRSHSGEVKCMCSTALNNSYIPSPRRPLSRSERG